MSRRQPDHHDRARGASAHRRPTRWAAYVAVVMAGWATACTGHPGEPQLVVPVPHADDQLAANAAVARVIDGDTIVVGASAPEDGEHVRLIGIDTPETKKPDTPVECFGPEASAHLHELLPDGTSVRIERDAELRDRYGRLLAYVYRASDGLFVNAAMAEEGFAAPIAIAPNVARTAEVAAAAARARAQHRGLWGACPGPHTTLPP